MNKITREEAIIRLQVALSETDKKMLGQPFQVLESIKNQLLYLLEALELKNDRSKLCDIIVGRYAASEFDASDPGYADILYKAAEISSLMVKGKL